MEPQLRECGQERGDPANVCGTCQPLEADERLSATRGSIGELTTRWRFIRYI
jgi:hypothetical protein